MPSVSWTALSEVIKNKSSDDLRHYWNAKIVPKITNPFQTQWTDQMDIDLLEYVESLDV